ncbi:MAG TPA: DUF3857 domain-containing protein [Pyrinomonadaceae bacterium]|nr:DUF3857 domain-containing protein [Pyrinomonadaceae bacterium]
MIKLQRLAGVCFALTLLAATAAAQEVPAWLKQAAAATAPAYGRDVPAVVLHRERTLTVADDGRTTTVTNVAVRVLTQEGRDEAVAAEPYLTDSEKVREMRAWLIHPNGDVKKYGGAETLDSILMDNDVYNEVRFKMISARADITGPNTVFGYTVTTESRSVFSQENWRFQDNLPTLVARYTLNVPAGWRASGLVLNHPNINPVVSGSSYTWEVRGLPFVEDEPSSPSMANIVPRLAVSYFPAGGARPALRTFENWGDVARWMSELDDPQATIDDALALKARELTANAKTELEKIRAVGRYVQGIQYISIQTNIGQGGGYRPRPATEVFAKSYGDCKDKANLMRAMLRALGINSYLVSIYSGDRTFVREEWPSPTQFNHCIIAVKVSDETQAPSVIEHPQLGRLLVFDATDPQTPVGDLPDHEQGSLALVDAKETTSLVRMPMTPPEANRVDREADVVLAHDGSISAVFRERSQGQSAVFERGMFKQLSRPGYTKMIEGWITAGGATMAKVSKIEPADDQTAGRFALDVEFTADRYAQTMQGQLLIFKPVIVSRTGLYAALGKESRRHPVVLESRAYNETVRVRLPQGFDVDELPEPVKLDSDFGSYAASYEVKDGHFVFTRRFVQRAATIPAAEYKQVRDFFGRIRAAEDSPVVLAKK